MLRWAEISSQPEKPRFTELSKALAAQGFENTVEFIEAKPDDFASVFAEATKTFDQLRIGGSLRELALALTIQMPSAMLTLKSADAFVKRSSSAGVDWWPANFQSEGIARALVTSLGADIDLTGAAFVMGAGPDCRAVVAALARLGFSRVAVSDPNLARASALIEDFKRAYFQMQFQLVPTNAITQLPAVHSITVNTLNQGDDAGSLAELFYFNFLKPGGLWLDLSLATRNQYLESEAAVVGAKVSPDGFGVAAWTDREWCREVLGRELDVKALQQNLTRIYGG